MAGWRVAIAILVIVVCGLIVWRCRGTSSDGEDRWIPSGGSARQSTFSQPRVRYAAGPQVAGLVLLDGQPVAGAKVRLGNARGALGQVTTDDAGRFDLGPQPAAAYVVVAEKAGHTAALMSIDLRKAPADDLRLLLHPCDGVLYGTVRDATGGSVRATVSRTQDMIALGGTETDEEGRYELCMPVGTSSTVEVKADGYAFVRADPHVNGRMRRDFVMIPEAIVVGRVVRDDQAAVIANETVRVELLAKSATPTKPGYVMSGSRSRTSSAKSTSARSCPVVPPTAPGSASVTSC